MKKAWMISICVGICIGFTACEDIGFEAKDILSEGSNHISTLLDGQTSIFNHLEVHGGDVNTVDLDVFLSQTEAAFLFIQATEELEVDLHYTYSTEGKDGIRMGRYLKDSNEKTSVELAAQPKDAFQRAWSDEKMTLSKGMNVLYLSGDDRNCRMYLEVKAENPDGIGYLGISDDGGQFPGLTPIRAED